MIGILETVSQMTGLPKDKLLKYSLIILALFVVFGIGQAFLTTLLGVVYPVYMSSCALESNNASDNREWLTYWVIFGLFNGIDYFSSLIPFYYFMKLSTLIWLFHPKF